jgi:hypothetical protein
MQSSLFPKSTVLKLLTKAQSNSKNDNSSVESALSALLRNQFHRPDLFSIFASLCGSKHFLIKLKSYQLAINNRIEDETILLVNQALKDLSHSYWGISLIAFQFLFYSDDEELVKSNVFFLLKKESTQRAALNSLHFFPDLLSKYESQILSLVEETGSLTSCMSTIDLRVSTSPNKPLRSELINLIREQLNSNMDILILNLIYIAEKSGGMLRSQLADLLKCFIGEECLDASIYFRALLFLPDAFNKSHFLRKLDELSFSSLISQEAAAECISKLFPKLSHSFQREQLANIFKFFLGFPAQLNVLVSQYENNILAECPQLIEESFEFLQFSDSLDNLHVQTQLALLLYLSSKISSIYKTNILLNEIVEFCIEQKAWSVITSQNVLLPNLYTYIMTNFNTPNANLEQCDVLVNKCTLLLHVGQSSDKL